MIALGKRGLDPRSAIVFAAGNVCLYTSVSLSLLGRGLSARHPALFAGLLALLLCLGVCFNFRAFHGSRRFGQNGAEKS